MQNGRKLGQVLGCVAVSMMCSADNVGKELQNQAELVVKGD